jgi:cation transport regulator ChaC
MAKKYKKLSDEAILAAVQANIDDGVGFWDSKLSRERTKVLNYFHGALPLPAHTGNSKYVSMDVYDTVESMKASLLETFSAGYELVEFTPQNADDVRGAKIASQYTDYVVFRENDGYKLFSDVITDGLLARNGVAKVFWDKDIVEEEEAFEDATQDALDALVAEGNVTIKDTEIDMMTGLISGTIIREVDKSQVRILALPPEEFMISPRAKCEKDAKFMAHRLVKTVSELKKMGLTDEQIDRIPTDGDIEREQEETARLQDLGVDTASNKKNYQDQVRDIRVHECYIRLDVDGTGIAQYWKITVAGDNIIDKEKIDRHPFVFFVPLPVPHSFFGSNFAAKVIPTQNARSILVRGILDHTVITNNPRTMVVKGALVNPKEMLENRVGGVVNVTRPDGVFPYPQSSLNPFVFQTINLLDEDKEDTTGISKLSQGMNKDAVSNQNSEGLVENLVGLSQQRQKIVARNFANTFLVNLYLEVYRLVIENEKQEKIVELAGDWVPIDVKTWTARKDVYTTLHLGYGEQGKESTKLMNLHQSLSGDPAMAPMYATQQKYNVWRKILEKEGMKNVEEYLINPKSPEFKPPEPDPKAAAETALLQAKVAELQNSMQVLTEKTKFEIEMQGMKHDLDKKQAMIDMLMDQREQERKEYETKTRAAVAEREIIIMEQSEPTKVSQSNIVSPNS